MINIPFTGNTSVDVVSDSEESTVEESHGLQCLHKGCMRVFTSELRLKNHLKLHKIEHKCEHCKKTFPTRYQLKAHIPIHFKKRRYACEHKGCKFSTHKKSSMEQHERMHKGIKPFKCSNCLRSFATKGILKTHQNSCFGLKPF